MKPNNLKEIWRQKRCALNGWLSIPSSFSAEIMAEQSYDSICIDLQHGLIDYQVAVSMLQAMRASEVVPLIRVPWLDPAAIMKALDAGAYGIICPMINSRVEAEALVSYVRYPPLGTRSYGPTRVAFSAGAGYAQDANTEILCFAMVETREAVDNLSEIVSTPGLDGIYIGPADLTIGLAGMRYPVGFDREEPDLVEVVKRILTEAHAAGIRAALHCGSPAYAAQAAGWGFDLVTVANDVRLLAGAAAASVKAFRDLTSAVPQPQELSGQIEADKKGGY